jgi:hypothetical protein
VLGKLTHLKSLVLDDCALMYEHDFLMNIHVIIPSLETLIMTTDLSDPFPMEINYLIEVLESIGNIKNLSIDGGFQYLLNNKEFRRPIQNNLTEGETKFVFERALEVINKTFPVNSTRFTIVDNESGWSIKKEIGKAPMMTKLPYKCTVTDDRELINGQMWGGETCTRFFEEKAKLEEHMKCQYSHDYPNIGL